MVTNPISTSSSYYRELSERSSMENFSNLVVGWADILDAWVLHERGIDTQAISNFLCYLYEILLLNQPENRNILTYRGRNYIIIESMLCRASPIKKIIMYSTACNYPAHRPWPNLPRKWSTRCISCNLPTSECNASPHNAAHFVTFRFCLSSVLVQGRSKKMNCFVKTKVGCFSNDVLERRKGSSNAI